MKKVFIVLFGMLLIIIVILVSIRNFFDFEIRDIFTFGIILFGIMIIILVLFFMKQNKNENRATIIKNSNELFDESETVICDVCDAENAKMAKHCKNCGVSLEDIVCPVCQTKNPFNKKYCIKCNTILHNKRRH